MKYLCKRECTYKRACYVRVRVYILCRRVLAKVHVGKCLHICMCRLLVQVRGFTCKFACVYA